jgi:hypothetical protein
MPGMDRNRAAPRKRNCRLAAALPIPTESASRLELKGFEDQLDAAICAWVAVCALDGRAAPFGDPSIGDLDSESDNSFQAAAEHCGWPWRRSQPGPSRRADRPSIYLPPTVDKTALRLVVVPALSAGRVIVGLLARHLRLTWSTVGSGGEPCRMVRNRFVAWSNEGMAPLNSGASLNWGSTHGNHCGAAGATVRQGPCEHRHDLCGDTRSRAAGEGKRPADRCCRADVRLLPFLTFVR